MTIFIVLSLSVLFMATKHEMESYEYELSLCEQYKELSSEEVPVECLNFFQERYKPFRGK